MKALLGHYIHYFPFLLPITLCGGGPFYLPLPPLGAMFYLPLLPHGGAVSSCYTFYCIIYKVALLKQFKHFPSCLSYIPISNRHWVDGIVNCAQSINISISRMITDRAWRGVWEGPYSGVKVCKNNLSHHECYLPREKTFLPTSSPLPSIFSMLNTKINYYHGIK